MSEAKNSQKIVFGMIWRFAEKITAQVVSFVVSIILARLLMPEDYGIVAIVTIFIAIAEVFVTSGLGTSLIQKKDADEIDFSTIFWCNILFSLFLYLVLFITSPFIAKFYKLPLLVPVLRVFGLRLPVSAINSVQNAYVSRNMDFKKFFYATLVGTVISAIIGIYMAYAGYGIWALVAQYLSNAITDTAVLFLVIKWKPKFIFSLERAKPLFDYGWKILATDLLGTVFNQLNAFVIGKKYTSEDLAYYTQGRKIPDLVNMNTSATLCAVLFPAMSLSSGVDEIKRLRRKSLKMLAYVVFPLMFGIIGVADKMIIVLMTDKWLFSVPYVRISCVAAIIGVLGTTFIQEVKAIGRSDVTLKIELIKKPIYLINVIIAMQFGVLAIAWTTVINECIAFACNVYPVKKYIGFDFKECVLDAMPSFVMSFIMMVAVWFAGKIISNDVVCLVSQIIIGGTIYVLLSYITKNESFMYIGNIVASKFNFSSKAE